MRVWLCDFCLKIKLFSATFLANVEEGGGVEEDMEGGRVEVRGGRRREEEGERKGGGGRDKHFSFSYVKLLIVEEGDGGVEGERRAVLRGRGWGGQFEGEVVR